MHNVGRVLRTAHRHHQTTVDATNENDNAMPEKELMLSEKTSFGLDKNTVLKSTDLRD